MTESVSATVEVFDAWAEVYDTQPNPLLSLEQRTLTAMLPNVRGLDVLDAGCGTGRWLERLADHAPRSLTGVDLSSEMLALAEQKLDAGCELYQGSCTALPVSEASADLILSSFVLSYLDDLHAFAAEIDRVARPGATILLADMHPATEGARNWKRSFSAGAKRTEIQSQRWPLEAIRQTFQDYGFRVVHTQEPGFGPPERQFFEECGGLDAYQQSIESPAIYVLQLRKPAISPRKGRAQSETLLLSGARCTLGAAAARPASVSIVGETIESIHDESRAPFLGHAMDLSGYLLLPGLINAHDHLEFALYPNLGNGPYENAAQWARDIQTNAASQIEQHRRVARSTSLEWGAIRNLLSGVTTVCHHNPVHPELLDSSFPVRVTKDFIWAHSLAFDTEIARKFAESDLPFILHAAEGIDFASAQEIEELHRMNMLSDRTVVVHALACTPASVALLNQRGVAVILCPTSNHFLFHRTPSLELIRSFDCAVLGSDSPLTAAGDLLDELRFTRTHIGVDAETLYAMVTTRAAGVLRCQRGEGAIRAGAVADLCVVRDLGQSPAETLAGLTSRDIELVIVGGRVQLAGASLIDRLPRSMRNGLQRLDVDGVPRWVRAPIDRLLTDAEAILGSDLRIGGKKVSRASAA